MGCVERRGLIIFAQVLYIFSDERAEALASTRGGFSRRFSKLFSYRRCFQDGEERVGSWGNVYLHNHRQYTQLRVVHNATPDLDDDKLEVSIFEIGYRDGSVNSFLHPLLSDQYRGVALLRGCIRSESWDAFFYFLHFFLRERALY